MVTIYRLSALKQKDGIVHTHGIGLYFALLACIFRSNLNFLHTVHNLSQNEAGLFRRLISRLVYKLGFSFPVTISDEVSESFREYYPQIRYKQIDNGLSSRVYSEPVEKEAVEQEVSKLKFNSDTKVYVSVGRLDYQKNREVLLDGFYKFSLDRNVLLLVIGGPVELSNPHYAGLISHPAVLNQKVCFLGPKTNVHDYLVLADYFCLTSRFEGLPIAVLEALRSGLICVCTPAGGVRSLLKDLGYLSDGFDAPSFLMALNNAENNPKNLSSLAIMSEFTNQYGMTACSKSYISQYKSIQLD
tara:strand:- start:2965 stop:3867 length:903 start_codon:yes stop_codon:yes gene_type:complete